MLMQDPTSVRIDQRKRVGQFSINGVDLAPEERTVALARELVDWIADVTVTAIQKGDSVVRFELNRCASDYDGRALYVGG